MAQLAITLDPNLRKNQKVYVPQPGLFDPQPKITIRLAPLKEGPMKKKAGLSEQAKRRLDRFKEWRSVVKKQLCPYPEKQELLKNSQERKSLDYQLAQVLGCYTGELGINLALLKGYQKADTIAEIVRNGVNEFQLATVQKLAGGLFLDARSSRSADDLRNAGELVTLVAILRDTCGMQAMLSRGEIVEPVRGYFVVLERKGRQSTKSALAMLSDKELCAAFKAYAKRAREIAEVKEETAQA